MDTVNQVQIMDEAVYISHSTWERYESNYSPSSYGQMVGQTGLFNLGMAAGQEGKLNLNLLNFIKKIDLILHPAHVEGVGKIYIYIYIYIYI